MGTRETDAEVNARRLRASVPEILVEAPMSLGLLYLKAAEWNDEATFEALNRKIAEAMLECVDLLAERCGDQDERGGWKVNPPRMVVEPLTKYHLYAGGDRGHPRPHAHLTLDPHQRYRDGRGRPKYVDPLVLEVQSSSAQWAFSRTLREGLHELGFHTTDVPSSLSPSEWELSAVADRVLLLPDRAPCPTITPGQRQFVPLDEPARRRGVA